MIKQPIVKWTGSKRNQAKCIVDNFPKNINTYYEPFIGSASILGELMNRIESGDITVNHIECSDINNDLITLFNMIKNDSDLLFESYCKRYNEFFKLDIDDKKKYFIGIRNEFNKTKDPTLFFWLIRTSYNGLIRYNKRGDYNSSCHFTRNGIVPEKLKPILYDWCNLLNKYNVNFKTRSYDEINEFSEYDFLYLDPPYINTHGMYINCLFDHNKFFKWINNTPAFILSYDGVRGCVDNTQDMCNKIVYDQHIYSNSNQSSFSKLKKTIVDVKDSIYIKRYYEM